MKMNKLERAIQNAQTENKKLSAIYAEAEKSWQLGQFEKSAELRGLAADEYEIVMRAWENVEKVRFGIK